MKSMMNIEPGPTRRARGKRRYLFIALNEAQHGDCIVTARGRVQAVRIISNYTGLSIGDVYARFRLREMASISQLNIGGEEYV